MARDVVSRQLADIVMRAGADGAPAA